MNLEEYKNLVKLQLISNGTLHGIIQAKKAYENNKIEQSFQNTNLFKPITDSNKELIDRIDIKTEQSDELIKKFTDSLPYYNQNTQQTREQLTIDDKTLHEEPKPSATRSLNIMNIVTDRLQKFKLTLIPTHSRLF